MDGSRHLDLRSELAWTFAAVLLTTAVGGAIMALVSLGGGAWWLDDFQAYFMPGYCEINRALREASYPLLSLSSWSGGDLAGEYQYGVFSVAHLSIILLAFQFKLGLSGTVAILIGTYTAILAAGAFRLARSYGLTVPNAMIACLAAALNGWIFYWGARTWFPAWLALRGCLGRGGECNSPWIGDVVAGDSCPPAYSSTCWSPPAGHSRC